MRLGTGKRLLWVCRKMFSGPFFVQFCKSVVADGRFLLSHEHILAEEAEKDFAEPFLIRSLETFFVALVSKKQLLL